MRSWWPSGRPQTTATAAVTLPPSWSSKMWTQGSPSYSGPFLIRKGSYHLERQHPTSSEVLIVACVQPSPFHCSLLWSLISVTSFCLNKYFCKDQSALKNNNSKLWSGLWTLLTVLSWSLFGQYNLVNVTVNKWTSSCSSYRALNVDLTAIDHLMIKVYGVTTTRLIRAPWCLCFSENRSEIVTDTTKYWSVCSKTVTLFFFVAFMCRKGLRPWPGNRTKETAIILYINIIVLI